MGDLSLRPAETRAQDSDFVTQCSFETLRHRLPLVWPVSDEVPPSPKLSYRSHYVYQGWDDLDDPATREHLPDFDLLLGLIDFSPLRDVLAQRLGWTLAKGQVPFDPVSIFLLIGWRIVNRWRRSTLLVTSTIRATPTMPASLASRIASSLARAASATGSLP